MEDEAIDVGDRISGQIFEDHAHARLSGPSLWPYLILCAVVAALIDLGHLHRSESADSIVPILTSLQRWTFYFWAEDRYGMLLAFLAIPFPHPLANLLVQEGLGTFCGLAAFFLFARYIIREGIWPVVATLATASVMVFAPIYVQFDWFAVQQYAVSFTLITSALVLAESRANRGSTLRLSMALLLSATASWVNVSVSIVFAPLLLLTWLHTPMPTRLTREIRGRRSLGPEWIPRLARDRHVRGLIVLAFGALCGWIMLHSVKHRDTNFGAVPPSEWPIAWDRLTDTAWQTLFPKPSSFPLLVAPALIGTLVLLYSRGESVRSHRVAGISTSLVGASLVWFLIVATIAQVKSNLYFTRYLYPSLFFLLTLNTALATFAIREWFVAKARAYILPCASVILVSLAMLRYGRPSVSTVRKDIDQRVGDLTPAILAAHANLIAGNYWTIWPAVFHANLVRYERGELRQIYGLSFRSGPTRKFWSRIPLRDVRAAVPAGQESEGENWLRYYGFNLMPTGRGPMIDILTCAGCNSGLAQR